MPVPFVYKVTTQAGKDRPGMTAEPRKLGRLITERPPLDRKVAGDSSEEEEGIIPCAILWEIVVGT